jgi:zinc protease
MKAPLSTTPRKENEMVRLSVVFATACAVAILLGPAACPPVSAADTSDRDQSALKEPIPQDPECIVGRLDNGLSYYIRVNREPERRALLWLGVNAGSILEDKDQQGLAHFVEHMGFNGTKHFPKQELIKRFEKLGVTFGLDLNAYTSFDETVYQLSIPTDSALIVETAFQALEDWARWMSFDDREIDKERGVIVEEWRLGAGADRRIGDKQIPEIFCNSKYAKRLPIGKKKTIESFNHATLKRFYRDWYRPDLMAVIAVGDFDPDRVRHLIEEHFASMPMPKHPRTRTIYPVPDHRETLVSIVTDPEATGNSVSLYFKRPVRATNTLADYRESVMEMLLNVMFYDRLTELSQKPDSPILGARAGTGRFVRSKAAYGVSASAKQNMIVPGFDLVLTEVERVRRYGFTEPEFDRAKETVLRMREKFRDESGKLDSRFYAGVCLSNFLRGAPLVPPDQQFPLYERLLPTITLADMKDLLDGYMTKENRVVLVSLPRKEGYVAPSDKEILAVVKAVGEKTLEPYQESVVEEPLIAEELVPAEITAERTLGDVGATEWTLSNGARVVLKPTDFNLDRISFSAMSPGGTSLAPDEEFLSARSAPGIVEESGYGRLTADDLKRKLTGTVASVNPYISDLWEGLSGGCSTKDVETLFQLIYLKMTSPRRDDEVFQTHDARWREYLKTEGSAPERAFWDTLSVTRTQYHFRELPMTEERLNAVDLDEALDFYRDRFSDASDFVFVFVGNFDMDEMKHLSEKYLGTLPATHRGETWKDVGVRFPTGVVKKIVRRGIEPKSTVWIEFNGPFVYSPENEAALEFMAKVLNTKLREVIREDMSGTYSVGAGANVSRFPRCEYTIRIGFGCAPDRVEELTNAVFTQIDSLKTFGIDSSHVERVQETEKRWHEREFRMNMVWSNNLAMCYVAGDDPATIFETEKLSESIDAKTVQETARKYIDTNRYIEVVLMPEK